MISDFDLATKILTKRYLIKNFSKEIPEELEKIVETSIGQQLYSEYNHRVNYLEKFTKIARKEVLKDFIYLSLYREFPVRYLEISLLESGKAYEELVSKISSNISQEMKTLLGSEKTAL